MKRVLAIVPYERIYPPINGGMLRCFHLLNQLAAHTDLTAIIHQDLALFLKAAEDYPAIRGIKVYSTQGNVAKKDLFSLMPQKIQTALRYRWQRGTFKGPADINFLLFHPVIRRLLKKEKFDFVFLENISSLNLVPLIRRLNKGARIIYDAHNVDSNLALEEYERKLISRGTYELIYTAEANLSSTVDGMVACSTADLDIFRKLNNNSLAGAVIPNGVNIDRSNYYKEDSAAARDGLLFCGSLDYAPNVEGLCWFYKEIWPILLEQLPNIKMTIIGGGTPDPQLAALRSANSIRFIGKVPDVRKFYQEALVSIVPLLSGSGTRLKILEAMSHRVPVVSTAKGAEGISHSNGKNILIADDGKQFADAVRRLMNDRSLHREIREKAYDLVAGKYDWNKIGNSLDRFLESL